VLRINRIITLKRGTVTIYKKKEREKSALMQTIRKNDLSMFSIGQHVWEQAGMGASEKVYLM